MSFADRLLALLGVIPPFLFLWWAERYERRVLEPAPAWRYRVLAAGGFVSVPVLLLGRLFGAVMPYLEEPLTTLYDAFIIAGLLEESAKAGCIFLLTRGALAPRTRYGALLYALHASMGFAVVENVIALLSTTDLESLTRRFMLRAYLAVPMHLATGGVFGYVVARKKFDGGALGWYAGLALAIVVHGGFDAVLYGIDRLPDEAEVAQLVCAYVAFMFPVVGLLTLWAFARRLRGLDGAVERQNPRGRRNSASIEPAAKKS